LANQADTAHLVRRLWSNALHARETQTLEKFMNPGNTHDSALSEKPKHCAHRPLAEDVLHSAQEDVLGEVIWQSHDDTHAWPGLLGRRVSNFAARQPLKASLLAMAAGAMLMLALQRGLARGKARI
jgi:hypothetical protein